MELASLPDFDFYQIHLNLVLSVSLSTLVAIAPVLCIDPYPDPSGNMLMGSIGYSALSLLKGKLNGIFWLWIETLVA